jgi:uncharacterized protein YcbK (DUF882 family)
MKFTEHFGTIDFACKCGCGYGAEPDHVDPELLQKLEKLRELCGNIPIIVRSGCRCQAHDYFLDDDRGEDMGRLKRGRPSFHVLGKAADIKGPPRELLRTIALQIFENNGVGLPNARTSDWVHVDTGPKRRWTYPA